MPKQKFRVFVWNSLFGEHLARDYSSYKELCMYLERLGAYNRSHNLNFYWSVYRRDFKNKEWVYMGGFDHA